VGAVGGGSTPTTVETNTSPTSPGPAKFSGAASRAGAAADLFAIALAMLGQFLI
jgi:hypothetical protein